MLQAIMPRMPSLSDIKNGQTVSICLLSGTSYSPGTTDYLWLEDLADELLVGFCGSDDSILERLPETRLGVVSSIEERSEGELANELLETASSDWVLVLRDGEIVSQSDAARMLHLLHHPILPCYEFPVRYYSELGDELAHIGEERYQDLGFSGKSFAESPMIRLFRADSGIHFAEDIQQILIGDRSTIKCRPFRCAVPIHVLHPGTEKIPQYNRNEVILRIYELRTLQRPQDWRVFEDLGMQCLEQALHAQAIPPFSRAVELNERAFLSMNAIGYACMQLQRYEEAFRWWERALSVNPGIHMAWMNMGVLRMRLGQWQQAAGCIARALSIQPDDPLSHYNLGQCFVRLKDYDRGAHHLRESIRYNPKYVAAYVDLGCLYQAANRIPDAVSMFEQALQIDPVSETGLYSLGSIYRQIGRDTEARELWRRLVRAYPGSRFVQTVRTRYPEVFISNESSAED